MAMCPFKTIHVSNLLSKPGLVPNHTIPGKWKVSTPQNFPIPCGTEKFSQPSHGGQEWASYDVPSKESFFGNGKSLPALGGLARLRRVKDDEVL
jgi:hypothetical protein